MLVAARAASLAGDWDRVAALVDRIAPATEQQRVELAFLTARAALHAELPARALRALDDAAGLVAPAGRASEAVLRGTALLALGRLDEGMALLERVAQGAGGPERAEAVYELAKAHRRAGRLDRAEAILAPLVDADRAAGCELSLAQALELYGRIELERRRRPVAARHFLDALDVLAHRPQAHQALRASLLHGLAAIAIEALDLRLFARVRRELESTSWPPGSAPMRVAVQRSCILGELLAGNEPTAWALAFEALRTAPAGSRYAAALLDAALVSRAAGDRFTPNRLALMAADVARHADWSGSDRDILLAVIRATAPLDAAAAGELLASYESSRLAGAGSGQAASSLDCLARAALAAARGQRTAQVAALRGALTLSRDGGNHYVEATCLVALLDLEPDDGLLRRADELTGLVPRSWLRRRFDLLAEHVQGPLQLTAAERRVMLAICEGRSTAEIAQRFGRSKNTIRNQTRRVYDVMHVRTRSALVSKCATMGLIPHT